MEPQQCHYSRMNSRHCPVGSLKSLRRGTLHLRLEAVGLRLSQLLRCVLAVMIMMMLTMMVMVIPMLMPMLSAILARRT